MTTIQQNIAKRHGLPDDAPIRLVSGPASMSMLDPFRFTARITTDSLDRDGEVMIPQGMDATEFEKTGTIFWNHNYDIPVAKAAGKFTRLDGEVLSTAEFAKRPGDYQGEFFPDFARAMVSQGIVGGVSIGFIPVHSRDASNEDRKRFGDGTRRVHTRWKLLEWSIAPVQSNPDAVVVAVGKGLLSVVQAKQFLGVEVKPPAPAEPKPEPVMQKRRVVYYVMTPPAPKPIDLSREIGKALKKMRGELYA